MSCHMSGITLVNCQGCKEGVEGGPGKNESTVKNRVCKLANKFCAVTKLIS